MNKNILNLILNILSVKKEETMKKSLGIGLMVFLMSFVLAISAFGADKLIVKDAAGTSNVFIVEDTGKINVTGADVNNPFQVKIMGHVGGSSHGQLVTDQSNSRFSFIAGAANDFAPRFQVVGAQDGEIGVRGWALFDYGSWLYNLPNAEFKIRHLTPPSTITDMLRVVGGSRVIFPTGRVGIGVDPNVNAKLDVNGPIYQRGVRIHADYVFTPSYKLETIEEHAKYMWENKHLKAVAKAEKDENGLDIVEVGAHQRGMLEELEKAHIFIDQLNEKVKSLEAKLTAIEANK